MLWLLRRILKVVAALVALLVLTIGALLAFVWIEHRSRATLPTPG